MNLSFLQQIKLNSWESLSMDLEGLEDKLKIKRQMSKDLKTYCTNVQEKILKDQQEI